MSNITEQTQNGVDVGQLMETIEAIQGQPELAKFQFRATNTWLGGGRSRTRIQEFHGAGQEDTSRTRPFTLEGDEPPVLLGENTASPDKVEELCEHVQRTSPVLDILRNPVRVTVARA